MPAYSQYNIRKQQCPSLGHRSKQASNCDSRRCATRHGWCQRARRCVKFWLFISFVPGVGVRVANNVRRKYGTSLPFPSAFPLSFPSPSFPSPPPPRSRAPQMQLGGLGERCKLPQRGLGRSPSRNRFWCILALKSGIWWQQCKWFSNSTGT